MNKLGKEFLSTITNDSKKQLKCKKIKTIINKFEEMEVTVSFLKPHLKRNDRENPKLTNISPHHPELKYLGNFFSKSKSTKL